MDDIILETQDLTWLSWSLTRTSSGTAGTFLKSYSAEDGRKIYYKLSDCDMSAGIVGHECINELIADRLLTLLEIPHLRYKLIHADIRVGDKIFNTWLTASLDFKRPGEDKIPLETYYRNNAYQGEAVLDFCVRMGWCRNIWEMLVCDFLILNRDRHGANIEVLRNRRNGRIRLAPLFDNGLSLVFSCKDRETLDKFDALADKRVQSFIGGNSAIRNLGLIPPEEMLELPEYSKLSREELFAGLDGAIDKAWLDKIWDMISGRWKMYEDIRSQRRSGNL
ncbi:hypothetical protein [uncultured Cloacibacillus sp.]|uniref:hypothetical protein n=1 Tax=uncultured Cloacibacillus sp. TaxID=889794 RepID=UPI003208CEEC